MVGVAAVTGATASFSGCCLRCGPRPYQEAPTGQAVGKDAHRPLRHAASWQGTGRCQMAIKNAAKAKTQGQRVADSRAMEVAAGSGCAPVA